MFTRILGLILLVTLIACNKPWSGSITSDTYTPIDQTETVVRSLPKPSLISPKTLITPSLTSLPGGLIRSWVSDEVPEGLRKQINLPAGSQKVSQVGQSNLQIGYSPGGDKATIWIYALVAPFPTIRDEVSLAELLSAWKGGNSILFEGKPLMLSPATRAAFTLAWGAPASSAIRLLDKDIIQAEAWKQKQAWAIVPFEEINPRWKVLKVDGVSPMDKVFIIEKYPLKIAFAIQGETSIVQLVQRLAPSTLPKTNRNPDKFTVLVMTGVTALVRGTAWMMEKMGMTFPGKSVRDWLVNADIAHVSNEVSFNPSCAAPNPNDPNLRFCSDPKYIELLEYLGVDVVEMTGNHLTDFGTDALLYTFDLYKQKKWAYFGAGVTMAAAMQPIKLSDHGNKIAFIGCNPAGPPSVWATETKPGAAKCNLDWEVEQIRALTQQGYLVIATFQFAESYEPCPLPNQYQDFRKLSDAGAVIVSGSQAHLPQAMELRENRFIHFGLGNLIFDQMDTYWEDTRYGFIDRHYFYDGLYLGTELLTTVLEDYTRPRPMTASERSQELRKMFDFSDWRIDLNKEWK